MNIIKNLLLLCIFAFAGTLQAQIISAPVTLDAAPFSTNYEVTGSLLKRVTFDLDTEEAYANVSLLADGELLIDNLDIPVSGAQTLNALAKFNATGVQEITLVARGGTITVNDITTTDVTGLDFPEFADVAEERGLITETTLKYGGPSVADMDNDGDYDFILNNHNLVPAKLFFNDGDNTFTQYPEILAQYDLHGTAPGDYDNDGDLDLVVTVGGGNGTNPQLPNFLRNDDNVFNIATLDAGITEGSRGRCARWVDMDKDDDLDLILINAQGINSSSGAIHNFYENNGDGTFDVKLVPDLEDKPGERVLITDINGDRIDDIILYWPLSVWQGNGDFTYTNVGASVLPDGFVNLHYVHAVADVDIDNDGDLDIYLARQQNFLQSPVPALDFDPNTTRMDWRSNGNAGSSALSFTAEGDLDFFDYDWVYRGYDEGFPLYLGSAATVFEIEPGDETTITQTQANGWATTRDQNGIYLGHTGGGNWNLEMVKNDDIYWSISFSVTGIDEVTPDFAPFNRNSQDYLLRNDGGVFTDVSEEWNIPQGGKNMGVTHGDFNNDGYNDLFVYRFGFLKSRTADYLLLNNGGTGFEISTAHSAKDADDTGHGDMGQAFDFDLDGDADMLNGSDELGRWYLYSGTNPGTGNYAIVDVNYGPETGIDPYSAEVTVYTSENEHYKRVGSAGEIFSQSLLNMVHFGLGTATEIDSIVVRWRNGETVVMTDLEVNTIHDTDAVAPQSIVVSPQTDDVRIGTSIPLAATILPGNADMTTVWTSSNPAAASVDQNGNVTGIILDEVVTVMATTAVGDLSDSAIITVVEFFPIAPESISIDPPAAEVIAESNVQLTAVVLPVIADNTDVTWSSSDAAVATVDADGVVTGVSAGTATITATTVENGLTAESDITVLALVAPFIAFDDESVYLNTDFETDGTLVVNTEYHAGTGNKVVASNYGGVKYWLREMAEGWNLVTDYLYVDESVLGTESGTSTGTISLAGAVPTEDLPEGGFYFLWVTFASDNGENYEKGLVGINVVGPNATENVSGKDIKVYPVPTMDFISLSGLEGEKCIAEFISLEGKLLLRTEVEEGSTIDVANLPAGQYLVRVQGETINRSFKIVKTN